MVGWLCCAVMCCLEVVFASRARFCDAGCILCCWVRVSVFHFLMMAKGVRGGLPWGVVT